MIGRVDHRWFFSRRRRYGPEVADPAHDRVEPSAGSEDPPVMRGHDPVAAEGGEVDAVVERLAVHDARAPDRRPERQRQANPGNGPAVARQEVEGGGLLPAGLRGEPAGQHAAAPWRGDRSWSRCAGLRLAVAAGDAGADEARAVGEGVAGLGAPGGASRALPRAPGDRVERGALPAGVRHAAPRRRGREHDEDRQRRGGADQEVAHPGPPSATRMGEALVAGHRRIVPHTRARRVPLVRGVASGIIRRPRARSSVDQSIGLRNRVSGVRIPPGAPLS